MITMRCMSAQPYRHLEALWEKSLYPHWMLASLTSSLGKTCKMSKLAPLQERRMIDRFTLYAKGGEGGNGCSSFRRSRQNRRGVRDGGNGGKGGDVILECSRDVWDFSGLQHHINAKRGGHGAPKNRIGFRGADKIVRVPVGTVIHLVEGELPFELEKLSSTSLSNDLDAVGTPDDSDVNLLESDDKMLLENGCKSKVVRTKSARRLSIRSYRQSSPRYGGPKVQCYEVGSWSESDDTKVDGGQVECEDELGGNKEESEDELGGNKEESEDELGGNKEESEDELGEYVEESKKELVGSKEESEVEFVETKEEPEDVLGEMEEESEKSDDGLQYNVAELTEQGQRMTIAQGGRGGLGNVCNASVSRKQGLKNLPSDDDSEDSDGSSLIIGTPGSKVVLVLELKSIADVGLVGMPNAGKSTLLGALSKAKPQVGDYAFTTLRPNLGKLRYEDFSVTVADIPGLIKGAHANRGLGHAFLRHIERTKVLAYVVDLAAALDGRKGIPPWEQLHDLMSELEMHQKGLTDRPSLIVANKTDEEGAEEVYEELKRRVQGVPIFPICAVLEEGVPELRDGLKKLVNGEETYKLKLHNVKVDSKQSV